MKKTSLMTVPALEEEWNERFDDDIAEVQPDDALFYEMEQNLPAYALYAGGGLAFFRKDDTPYLKDEDGTPMCLELEPYQHELVKKRLEGMSHTPVGQCGLEGVLIPLRAGARFETVEDVNEYLHNLMFWESLLPPETCGPLMQHIGWLVQKLYTLREQEDERPALSLERFGASHSRAAASVAAGFLPIPASPVPHVAMPPVQKVMPSDYEVADYPSLASRAVAAARFRAQVRTSKRGRGYAKPLGALAAKRYAKRMEDAIQRVFGKGDNSKKMYWEVTKMLVKQSPGLKNVLGSDTQVRKFTVGKGETVFLVIPSDTVQKL